MPILTTALELLAGIIGAGLLLLWSVANYWFSKSTSIAKKNLKAKLSRRASLPVAAIMAARNEEKNIARSLGGLIQVGYPLAEIIVVDDESTDKTPLIVENLSKVDRRIRIVRVENRPKDWMPKPYALSLGAKRVDSAEILFFVDADIEVEDAELLQRIIGVEMGSKEILALIPRFKCTGFYCKAAQAFMTGTVHAFYGFHRVADPRNKFAWMYGCCWLVKHEYYRIIGGHELVKNSIVEDRDMATVAKIRGASITPLDATKAISVKTYETLRGYRSLIARLTIDRASRIGSTRTRIEAAIVAFIHLAPLFWPILLAVNPLLGALYFSSWLLQEALYARGSRYNNYSPLYSIPAVIAGTIPVVAGIMDATSKKNVEWKNRTLKTPSSLES